MSTPWFRRDPLVAFALVMTGACLGVDLLRSVFGNLIGLARPFQGRSGTRATAVPPPRPVVEPGDSYGDPLTVQFSELRVLENPGDPPPYDPVQFRDWLAVENTHGTLRVGLIVDPSGKVATARPTAAWSNQGTAEYLAWYAKQWKFAPYLVRGRACWVRTDLTLEVPPAWGTDRRGLLAEDPVPVPESQLRFTHLPAPETWMRIRALYDQDRPKGGQPFRGVVRVNLVFDRDGSLFDAVPGTTDPPLRRAAAVLSGPFRIEPYRIQGLPRFVRTTVTLRFWPDPPSRIGTTP